MHNKKDMEITYNQMSSNNSKSNVNSREKDIEYTMG